jgi:phospholipid/cholesterol/gamma-HCH transport system substrate-binding protein
VRHAIQKHMRDFIAIIALSLFALGITGYILAHQRFYLPNWVPVLGTDFFELKGEFSTAQSVTPGQGQTVDIAGVPVGEIKKVELEQGRAIVTMAIKQKYAHMIKSDATMLLRPKTGLKDMIVELNPGTQGTESVKDGFTVPVSNTRPDVNLDEILSSLDRDTRDYLRLFVAGAGEGLKNNGPNTAATLKRFAPLSRDIRTLTGELAKRRVNLARLVHNLQLLITEIGGKDKQLAELVVSQNAVFQAFANQDRNLRKTFELLPGALDTTQQALKTSDQLSQKLGPTLRDLRPGARALGPSSVATQAFAKATRPIIHNQLRPFVRQARPTVDALRPALRDLAKITPDLATSFGVLNKFFNALAYNPSGVSEGYLFYALWLNHIGASVYSTQDANGPIRRGVILTDCIAAGALENVAKIDAQLGTLIALTNFPSSTEICGK